MIDTDLKGPIFLSQAALPQLKAAKPHARTIAKSIARMRIFFMTPSFSLFIPTRNNFV